MQQSNNTPNQPVTPENGRGEAQPMILTDLLANLCIELAQLFSTISRVTHTCLGLKEHLVNSTASSLPDVQKSHRVSPTPNDGKGNVGKP